MTPRMEKSLEDIIEPYNDHQGLRDIHKALYRAVDSRNVDDARILLDNGGEISHSYEKPRSAWTNLHYAASRGDMAMAELLLLAGINVDGQAENGMQPIHGACGNNLIEIIRLLLDAGADTNCVDRLGRRPLHLVLKLLASDAIRLLVSRGADLEVEMEGIRRRTPLDIASGYPGHTFNVRTLFEFGAKADIESPSSYSPLKSAIVQGNPQIVKALLRHGADPNLRHPEDNSTIALVFASCFADGADFHPNVEYTISLLFEHGADIQAQDREGNLDLHFLACPMQTDKYYASLRNRAQSISYLIRKGADPNIQNHKQETPLSLAILRLNIAFVELILELSKGYLVIPEKQRLTCRLLELKSQGHVGTKALSHGQSSTSNQSAKVGRMSALVDMSPSTDESLGIALTL